MFTEERFDTTRVLARAAGLQSWQSSNSSSASQFYSMLGIPVHHMRVQRVHTIAVVLAILLVQATTQALQAALDKLVHDRRLLDAQQHGFLNVSLSQGKRHPVENVCDVATGIASTEGARKATS